MPYHTFCLCPYSKPHQTIVDSDPDGVCECEWEAFDSEIAVSNDSLAEVKLPSGGEIENPFHRIRRQNRLLVQVNDPIFVAQDVYRRLREGQVGDA